MEDGHVLPTWHVVGVPFSHARLIINAVFPTVGHDLEPKGTNTCPVCTSLSIIEKAKHNGENV